MKNSSLVDILRQLIAYRTVSGEYEQAAECLSYIEQWCSDRGLFTQDFVQGGFPSLVVSTRENKKFNLLLSAHIDVLPGHEAQFSLIKDGKKFYGRGVYDMKFAVACYMMLIDELRDELAALNIGLMFTSDEELGGENGVKALVEQGFMADVCIVPDGGDNWCIEQSAKGGWLVRMVADGKPAHGSKPWEGDNAAEKLVRVLPEILDLNDNTPEGVSVVLSKMKGGEAINSVAERAEACLDIRFTTLEDYERVYAAISKLSKAHGFDLKSGIFIEPARYNLSSSAHKAFQKSVAEVLNVAPDKIGGCVSLGGSDGRFFVKRGADVVVCRPIGGGAHAEDEWLDEQSFYQYYEVLKRFILL